MGVLNCNGVCLSNLQALVLVSCFKLDLLLIKSTTATTKTTTATTKTTTATTVIIQTDYNCYNKGCAIKAACCMFSAQKRLHSSFEHCLQTLQKSLEILQTACSFNGSTSSCIAAGCSQTFKVQACKLH